MKRIKKNDVLLKLLSLVLAIIVWIYVAGTNNFQEDCEIKDIKLTFLGLDDLKNSKNLVLTWEDDVDIEVSGSYSDLLALEKSDVKVVVDLSRIRINKPGTYEVPYTVELPSAAYSVKKKDPQNVKIKFDQEETKMIPVIVNTEGIAAKGYIVRDQKASPNELRLSGLQEDVDKVDHVTVNTGMKDMKSEVKGDFPYKFYDKDGNCLENISVSADYDKVSVIIPVLKTKTVKLRLDLQVKDELKKYIIYSLETKELEIAGEEDEIADISDLVIGTVKLSDAFSEEQKTFMINPPDGIVNISGVFETKAKVELNGMESKTVMASYIDLKKPEVLDGIEEVKLITTSLPVTVYAPQEKIESISDANIAVYVDLSSARIAKGKQLVEATVEVKGISDVIIKDDEYLVSVEVS